MILKTEIQKKNATIVTGLIATILSSVLAFFFTKILISNIGTTINGKQQLILSIISYFSLVHGGLYLGIVAKLYKPLQNKNWQSVENIFIQMKRAYQKIAWFFLVLGLLSSIAFAYFSNYNLNTPSSLFLILLFAINILPLVINFMFFGKYTTLIQADNEQYLINIFSIIFKIISYSIAILLLFLIDFNLSKKVISVGSINNAVAVDLIINKKAFLSILILAIVSFSNVGISAFVSLIAIKKYKKHFNGTMIEKIKFTKIVGYTIIYQFSIMIVFSTDALTLSLLGSDSTSSFLMVTIFSLYTSISNIFKQLLENTISGSRGIIGKNIHKKEKLNSIMSEVGNNAILLSIVSLFINVTWTAFVVDVLFPQKGYFLPTLAMLFAVSSSLYILSLPAKILFETSGNFKQIWPYILIEAIINIGLSIGLFFVFGVYGVILATVISMLYKLIAFEILSKKEFNFTIFNKKILKHLYIIIPIIILTICSFLWNELNYQSGFNFERIWEGWLNPIQVAFLLLSGLAFISLLANVLKLNKRIVKITKNTLKNKN